MLYLSDYFIKLVLFIEMVEKPSPISSTKVVKLLQSPMLEVKFTYEPNYSKVQTVTDARGNDLSLFLTLKQENFGDRNLMLRNNI